MNFEIRPAVPDVSEFKQTKKISKFIFLISIFLNIAFHTAISKIKSRQRGNNNRWEESAIQIVSPE